MIFPHLAVPPWMDLPLGAGINLAWELLVVGKVTQLCLVLTRSRGEEGRAPLGRFIRARRYFYLAMAHVHRSSCPSHSSSLSLLRDAQRFPMFPRGCSKPRHVPSELGVVFNEGRRSLPALRAFPGGNARTGSSATLTLSEMGSVQSKPNRG